MKNKLFILLFVFCSFSTTLKSQELKARVTVNSDRVQGSNKSLFTSLEKSLNNLINGQKWSTANVSLNERVECTFSLIILGPPENNQMKAELMIQARRPVYNSAYSTTLLSFRDTRLQFEYIENTPLEFISNSINNNLVATIAFYCNLILALDFDSFSPQGGSAFYREAQSIVNQAQSNATWTGWTAFDADNNRHGVITAFMDESVKPFREMWYSYHRKGLDEMAANPDRGRTTILGLLPVMDEVRKVRSSSVLVQMFADSKLDEIVALSSKASAEEKKTTYELLRRIYPTMSAQLEPLKK